MVDWMNKWMKNVVNIKFVDIYYINMMDDEDFEEMRVLRGKSSERFDFIFICFMLFVCKEFKYLYVSYVEVLFVFVLKFYL